jgi:hypothetical protein
VLIRPRRVSQPLAGGDEDQGRRQASVKIDAAMKASELAATKAAQTPAKAQQNRAA